MLFSNPFHTLGVWCLFGRIFAAAVVTEHQYQDSLVAFEVQSGGTLLRRQGAQGAYAGAQGAPENASLEGSISNVSGDLGMELARAEALRQEMRKGYSESEAKGEKDVGFHWDQLGDMANGSNTTLTTTSLPKNKCLQPDSLYLLPMQDEPPGQNSSQEPDHQHCKERCQRVEGCSYWSYMSHGACFLQNASARKVAAKGVLSGTPGCEESSKSKPTSAHHTGPASGGQNCYHLSASFTPLDLLGEERTQEATYDLCQGRCLKTKGCTRFTYFMEDQGCHLQSNGSHLVFLPGSIAGESDCNASDKVKFDSYMKSLPRMDGKNGRIPCEDSWASFAVDDDDLTEPEDSFAEVTCGQLKTRGVRPGAQSCEGVVRQNCPVLCGFCGEVGECGDGKKDEHPVFFVGNETLGCEVLQDACHHDQEVDMKCKETCGLCTRKDTQRLEKPSLEKISCNRRRSMGYCFTRRRRLF